MAKNWYLNTDEKFQKEWKSHHENHSTENYRLKYVFEIYLPFWQVKQNVFVEKVVEDNRFTKILLRLIQSNINSHSQICSFLGIEEGCFCVMQLDFLAKNGFIREVGEEGYEITHAGLAFLEDKTTLTEMEEHEFEFLMAEKAEYLKDDMTGNFFDPRLPMDKQLSEMKKLNFSGYKVLESHKIKSKVEDKIQIPHENKPTHKKLVEHRNDFSDFFNRQHKSMTFYDFAETEIECHKRNICFLAFLYENEENPEDKKIDVRRSKDTVIEFKADELEHSLSKLVTEYALKNNVKIVRKES